VHRNKKRRVMSEMVNRVIDDAGRAYVRSTPRADVNSGFGAPLWAYVFVCGDQSGRTSAPTSPHAVQTIFGQRDRIGVSSGSRSAVMSALWLHQTDSQ
jgi:hypothetical protein